EPLNRDNVKLGSQQAFGQIVETTYKLDAADVIVSLDADFLNSTFPGFEVYARQFSARRQPDDARGMSRFYAIETAPTNTGAKADHRLGLKPSKLEQFARALSSNGGAGGQWSGWSSAIAQDLLQHHG